MGILIGYVVPAIHVVACVFLIVVVLLQTGKGADMGAVFGGGGSQTLFGSSGAGNFLTKLTTGTAIAFMITSLILTYGASRSPTSHLIERLPSAGVPAAPEPQAAGEPAPAAEPPVEAQPPVAQAPAPETPPAAAPEPAPAPAAQ